MLNSKKELTPVYYGDSCVKILHLSDINAESLCFEMHWHERIEIIYVLSGSIFLDLGNETSIVRNNSVIVIPPEQPHHGIAGSEGVDYYTIMFELTTFYNKTPVVTRILQSIVNKTITFSNITHESNIKDLLNSIIENHSYNDDASSLIEVGKIYELLGLLYRFCAIKEQSTAVSNARFRDVLNYINENVCSDMSSSYLSKKFGYDESYFSRRFKITTGLSPTVYIRILRLEKAKELLKQNDLSIAEISDICAFSDSCYFSRCFKTHYKVSPTEFRSKHNKI